MVRPMTPTPESNPNPESNPTPTPQAIAEAQLLAGAQVHARSKPYPLGLKIAIAGIAVSVLVALGVATHERNKVWATEDSLWEDTILKSPDNGRALMNYGLQLMSKGETTAALMLFEKAHTLTPNYWALETNLAICKGEMGRDREAFQHFIKARDLAPNNAQVYAFYARYLDKRVGNHEEAVRQIKHAMELEPSNVGIMDIARQIGVEVK